MWEVEYSKEPIDGKLIWLRFLRSLWIFPVCAIIGACLLGGLYSLDKLVIRDRSYQIISKYHADFATNSEGVEYEYLNHYTWETLATTDMMAELIGNYIPDVSADVIKASVARTIESDVRMPNSFVTTNSPELTVKIARAVELAMADFGEANKEFVSILVIDAPLAAKDVSNIRVLTTLILGACIGLLISLFVWFGYVCADTSAYIPATLEKRYHIPTLTAPSMDEFEGLCGALFASYKRIGIVSADDCDKDLNVLDGMLAKYISKATKDDGKVTKNDGKVIKADAQTIKAEDKTIEADDKTIKAEAQTIKAEDKTIKAEAVGIEIIKFTNPVLDDRTIDAYVVTVKAGAHNGKRVERVLEQLARQNAKVAATVLVDESEKLISSYY